MKKLCYKIIDHQ